MHTFSAHSLLQDGLYQKADQELFRFSDFLFSFASSHNSLGYSVGVGGMFVVLRHPVTLYETRRGFPPFSMKKQTRAEKRSSNTNLGNRKVARQQFKITSPCCHDSGVNSHYFLHFLFLFYSLCAHTCTRANG